MNESHANTEIDVGFYLIGKLVDPDRLSVRFSVTPSTCIRAGDERRRKSTNELLGHHSEGIWGFRSIPEIVTHIPDDHFSYIASFITKNYLCLQKPDSGARPFVEISMASNSSCVIPEEFLGLIKEIGAELGIVSRTG
jgi:hypothetical protein